MPSNSLNISAFCHMLRYTLGIGGWLDLVLKPKVQEREVNNFNGTWSVYGSSGHKIWCANWQRKDPLGLEDLRSCTEEVTFEVNLEGRARIFQVKRREKEDLTLGESESQVSWHQNRISPESCAEMFHCQLQHADALSLERISWLMVGRGGFQLLTLFRFLEFCM